MHPTSTLTPAAPAEPDPEPETPSAPVAPTTPEEAALGLFGSGESSTPSSSESTPAVAPQDDGGPGLGYLIPNALGFGLPDPETFQNMSAAQKAEAYGAGSLNAIKKLVSGAISVPIQGLGSLAATGIEGVEAMTAGVKESIKQGKLVSPETAFNEEAPAEFGGSSQNHVSIPLGPFGSAPSWFKTYDDAIDTGASPLAASLLMGGTAIGDITIAGGISESMGNLAKPKPSVTGEPVTNLEPIQTAITSDSGKVKFSQKADSVNEYYDTSPAVAKQYGGNPGNIKVKLSPVGDGTMQASIVKLGAKGDVPSDFVGLNETPLYSQNVPMVPQAQEAVGGSGMVPLTPEEMQARGIPVPPDPQEGAPAPESTPEEAPEIGSEANQIAYPKKAAKGTEDFPITQAQMNQLDLISKVNGLGDNVKLGVINALTGKTAVGDLTNEEFVQVATQLGKLDKATQYSPTLGMNNIVADWLGRRDSYFNSVEERTGIPTGQMYNRLENARRLGNIATETNDAQIHDIYGSYWNDPTAGDLVTAYKGGNKDSILNNTELSDQEKADLIRIAEQSKALQAKMAVQYNLPEEQFLENYSSHIQDKGGAVTQYSDPNEFPTGSKFFAKQKRTGSLTPLLTDDRAIMGIYNHSGAKATFMPDALKFAKDVYDSADPQYKPAIKAYADAMAGNADIVERSLNDIATNLNQKLGLNLAPDAARKLVQLTMDTTYAASMGFNPGTYLRQLITNPTFVYAENGAAGLGDAMASYFKDPAAAQAELSSRGFRVKTADPYGSAIADQDTQFGKLGVMYRKLTSASLAPMNTIDSFGRYLMMKSSDSIFNNAIDLYNEGKMTWPQVENSLDFDGMSPVDRNQIRQSLVQGDRQAAMDHLARVKIDDTQGTYRPATMGRMMNGALGKPTFQFSAYADNYINMISKWAKYGQWDKLVRFAGTQAIVYKTMLNQFGLNYGSDMGVSPAIPAASPLVKTTSDFYNLIQAVKNNSQTDIDTNKDAIVSELQSLGFPGVEPARVKQFISIYQKGPNAQGLYEVPSGSGKENYAETFSDLLWGNLFGFPSADKANAENVANNEVNASTNYTDTKNQILQMIGAGNTAQAKALMASSGVTPTGVELNNYLQAQNIPLTLRLYEQLPKVLQPQFSKQVLSTLHPGQ
jgi:hypothetical protein